MWIVMFAKEAFNETLIAYNREISKRESDDFTKLKRSHKYFSDITDYETVGEQVDSFVSLISEMDRDEYANRYVILTFIQEFCKYLDKDFLFKLKDPKTFFSMKDRLKEFTGNIYETNKRFTQNVGLFNMEHLLEDYGTLLTFGESTATSTSYTPSNYNPSPGGSDSQDTGSGMFGKLW